MKGHKSHRSHRATGGVNEAAEDMAHKNQRYTFESKVNDEAEERKHGGRTKKKHVGKVHGEAAEHHAGRKPRKSGGRAGSNMNPLSSAARGTPARGRDVSGSV